MKHETTHICTFKKHIEKLNQLSMFFELFCWQDKCWSWCWLPHQVCKFSPQLTSQRESSEECQVLTPAVSAERCQERVEGFFLVRKETSSNILMVSLRMWKSQVSFDNHARRGMLRVRMLFSFGEFESKQFWQWVEWRSTKTRTQLFTQNNLGRVKAEAAIRKAKNWALLYGLTSKLMGI